MVKKQKFPHLLGSKWTAQQTTWGWRHFQVVNRKNQEHLVFAELVAACDSSVRFWINAQQLKQRALWKAGWQPLQEIAALPAQPQRHHSLSHQSPDHHSQPSEED